jgi:hypothetical protein
MRAVERDERIFQSGESVTTRTIAVALVMAGVAIAVLWRLHEPAPSAFASSPRFSTASRTRSDASLQKLSQIAPHLHFAATPLDDAIDVIRRASGANIAVDWRPLEIQGIGRTMPINLDLDDVSFALALTRVLGQTRTGQYVASYGICDGIVVVTTSNGSASGSEQTRTYDVSDLIRADTPWRNRVRGTRFESSDWDAPGAAPGDPDAILLRIIEASALAHNQGLLRTMNVINGRLIVTDSVPGHRSLQSVLEDLRAPDGVMPRWTKPQIVE